MEEIKVISSLYVMGQRKAQPIEIANEIQNLAGQIENSMQENSFVYAVWMSLQRIKMNYRPEDYLLIYRELSRLDNRLFKPLLFQICLRGYLYERSEDLMKELLKTAEEQGLGPGLKKNITVALLWLQLRNPKKYQDAETELNKLLEV